MVPYGAFVHDSNRRSRSLIFITVGNQADTDRMRNQEESIRYTASRDGQSTDCGICHTTFIPADTCGMVSA